MIHCLAGRAYEYLAPDGQRLALMPMTVSVTPRRTVAACMILTMGLRSTVTMTMATVVTVVTTITVSCQVNVVCRVPIVPVSTVSCQVKVINTDNKLFFTSVHLVF